MKRLHIPVMVEEVLGGLAVGPGKIFLDGTVGCGGHAEAILKKSSPDGRLIGLDRDREGLKTTAVRLKGFGRRVILAHSHFSQFDKILNEQAIAAVDGMLLDLGISSHQLATAERGFSFREEGPLDMRMDPTEVLTAREIVNRWPAPALEKLFLEFGEERFARRYAKAITAARERKKIISTPQLAQLIRTACPQKGYHRIDPATRVFQALRIAVNRELEELDIFLGKFLSYLKPAGRVAILSYHSLEDRRVKRCFQEAKRTGQLIVPTKKPLTASRLERATNPSARSAKLRIAEFRGYR